LQGVPSMVELTILDAVSPMKNQQRMKSITWGTSPKIILMQVDFPDSSMDNNTTNNRDNGGTTLGINSIETRVDRPQGRNNKILVSMIRQRSWKRLWLNLCRYLCQIRRVQSLP